MAGSDRLSGLQRRGVHAVLACRTVAESAERVGVSERTVRRWQTDPRFRDALRDEARAAARRAVDGLLAGQVAAVQVLRDALADPVAGTRIRAATALLEHGQRVAGDDLDERLTALEGRAERWAGSLHVV